MTCVNALTLLWPGFGGRGGRRAFLFNTTKATDVRRMEHSTDQIEHRFGRLQASWEKVQVRQLLQKSYSPKSLNLNISTKVSLRLRIKRRKLRLMCWNNNSIWPHTTCSSISIIIIIIFFIIYMISILLDLTARWYWQTQPANQTIVVCPSALSNIILNIS